MMLRAARALGERERREERGFGVPGIHQVHINKRMI